MPTMTRRAFAHILMEELGVPDTLAHIGARRFLVAWMHGESGENPGFCNGVDGQGAKWNPLNTTLPLPGSTFYNHLSPTTGVQNYRFAPDGALAVRQTLEGDKRYAQLLALFHKSFVRQRELGDALAKSPWGTHEPLVTNMLNGYNNNRRHFNTYPIGT